MAERQRSAATRTAGGRNERWPLVIERVDEVPPVLAHDLMDAAVAVFTVLERGVRAGVFRWVKADPL